ncbi:MAG: DNA polymerase Y family protein [Actinomycetota bacterium]
MAGIRTLVVWCPDWPLIAWGVPLDEPAVVTVANRVVATSPAARTEGVAVGQRRREAQGRCPDLAVLDRDVDREARLFEPVAAVLEALTPRIEVSGPGLVGFPTRGPSRFFGGDHAMAAEVMTVVEPVLARRGSVRVGVADGVFAARLAARSRRSRDAPLVIPAGEGAAFLAPLSVGTLEMEELAGVLRRLGITTLGALAALPAADIVGRFGVEGQLAHRLARGEDDVPPDLRRPAPDLAVTWQFEPPADRVESCAFVAKMLADDLHSALGVEGLACTRVAVEAETEDGRTHLRLWRHEGALSAAAIAERTRWQLDGWIRQRSDRPGSGIVRLTLVPDEVVPATGRQLGFWGGRNENVDDVTRVVARLQAMLGPEAVSVPELTGGIGPGERVRLVPAAAVDLGEERLATDPHSVVEPWPGRIPAPSPSRILIDPVAVEVTDHGGQQVGVTGRGEITGAPALVRLASAAGGGASGGELGVSGVHAVEAWAGPWGAEQRWWDPIGHRRCARMQVVLASTDALLLILEQGEWAVEAVY